ncbi:helix-turn-helix transcriptional regulator [Tissierella sp.]|uniref:helix-turn-helix domain-containing protein n=1 Tax=Tissierella sp. TaxID=41274 RepID=UPI003020EF7D
MDFGEKLKYLRENNDMTRDDLANKLNVSYSTISKYETNVRFPDQEMLVKIADLFNVSTDYLLGRSDIPNPYTKENTSATDEIANLSPESQEEIKKLIELYKIRDMQKRNTEFSDELSTLD